MDQTRGLALPGPGRLEAFSDGVLAIAITLLVLEIKVPHLEAGRVSEPTMNSAADFAAHVPTAMVFRAFNSLGWENFADPLFDGIRRTYSTVARMGMPKR